MDLPGVLIVSNNYEKTIEIIEKLKGKFHSEKDNCIYFALNIDNKYYTTKILLCTVKNLTGNIPTEGVEGLIIYEDLDKADYNYKLDNWSSVIDLFPDIEVHILICDSLAENSNKDKVEEWCTQKRFELIELECSDVSELENLESEHSTFGIDRINEALHAHRWPNLTLKGQSSNSGGSSQKVSKICEEIENINLTDVVDRLEINSVLDGLMGDEDTDFGELFGQLRAMKDHVMSLPLNERRNTAEIFVTALWKAMGGNELDEQ